MQEVEDQTGKVNIEDLPEMARATVQSYCVINGYDESDIPPTVWNDIITELNIKVFYPNKSIYYTSDRVGYNIDYVEYIYEYIYKRLCNTHCQEITQKGFCDMVGMTTETLHCWRDEELSGRFSSLSQKIMMDNEESLFALMKDRRNNPMKYLPALNKRHAWNMPGVREQATRKAALSIEDIKAKLNKNSTQLIDDGSN